MVFRDVITPPLRIYVFLCSPGTLTQFLTIRSTFFFEPTVYRVLS